MVLALAEGTTSDSGRCRAAVLLLSAAQVCPGVRSASSRMVVDLRHHLLAVKRAHPNATVQPPGGAKTPGTPSSVDEPGRESPSANGAKAMHVAGQSLTKLVEAVCGLPLAKEEQISSTFRGWACSPRLAPQGPISGAQT